MRSDTAVRAVFTATGGLDTFTVSFPVYAAGELKVARRTGEGTEAAMALGTDYSVALLASLAGARVTLLRALAAGTKVSVASAVPMAQELELAANAALRPKNIEKQLDRIVQQIQQNAAEIRRKVGLLATDSRTDAPSTNEVMAALDSSITTAQGYASAAGGSASAASASASTASAKADEASGSAAAASGSATASAGSATAAAASEANAAASAASAAAALAEFSQVSATASTLAPGSSATASYDAQTHVFSLGIPQGAKGDTGAQGPQGETGPQGPAGQSGFPEQSGQAGKFLTTDGSDVSWAAVSGALPSQSAATAGKFLKSDGSDASWDAVDVSGAIGTHNSASDAHSSVLGDVSTMPEADPTIVDYIDDVADTVETLDSNVVHTTGNETIGGEKTYTAFTNFKNNIYFIGTNKDIVGGSTSRLASYITLSSNNIILHSGGTQTSTCSLIADVSGSLTWGGNEVLTTANGATTTALSSAVSTHDASGTAHSDIRTLASTAQSTANAAQSTANAAQTTANAAQSTANAALPKSGGTMTGSLKIETVQKGNATGVLSLYGGTSYSTGAYLWLYGKSAESNAGNFQLGASYSSSSTCSLVGTYGGSLSWNGQPIQTSSDASLKRDAGPVPDAFLDAWGAMDWLRFRFRDAYAEKGEAARYHAGVLAQNAMAQIEAAGGSPLAYGIFCKLADEADPETGEVHEGKWTVRYEEALAMEAAYLRREVARLKARLDALEGSGS